MTFTNNAKIFLKKVISLLLLLSILMACKKAEPFAPGTPVVPVPPVEIPADTVPSMASVRSWLADKNASMETAAMFYNLKKISRTNTLFGHQDDTKRGYDWANEAQQPYVSTLQSDVKAVTGAYPAVYGHDFLHIANFADGDWYDYERNIARQLTIEAYERGGINTYSWHYANPVSKGSFYWDQSPVRAVNEILPGGAQHEVYKNSLKEIAHFSKSLVASDGKLVPVIFRPFHEFDGDWFWWGKAHCSASEYKSLYQFTVAYLRDSLGVHNFLYAWSPDCKFENESQYLERYPGDDFVDIVGMDNYWDLKEGNTPSTGGQKLKVVSDYAKKRNKVAALTETGLDNVTQSDWYTQVLLKVLKYTKMEIAYALVWSNTKSHYWTPYKGHAAESDFINFKKDNYILFSDEVKNMYEIK